MSTPPTGDRAGSLEAERRSGTSEPRRPVQLAATGIVETVTKRIQQFQQTVLVRKPQLGIAKHAGPFRETQVGGDDHAGFLIQFTDQMKQ